LKKINRPLQQHPKRRQIRINRQANPSRVWAVGITPKPSKGADTVLTLSETKEFLRVDETAEDDYIGVLILLSAEIVRNFLRLGDDEELPENNSVKQAELLIIGYFFENRQGTKDAMPPAVYHLLSPYRKAEF